MKIIDILKKKKHSVSFEVFPPKTEIDYDAVYRASEEIATLAPSFISVTYGAGGSMRGVNTLNVAKNIKEKSGVETLAHLTCVASTKSDIDEWLARYRDAGIENIMALRGDYPAGCTEEDKAGWAFSHADSLVKEIKAFDRSFCVGGACYPETHPESKSAEDDIFYLKKKTDAGCDFLTTQLFFDNALFFDFCERLKSAGVNVPVLPGIMPITNAVQIERVVKLSGSFIPERFRDLIEKYGNDNAAMSEAGIEYATEQIRGLFENGVGNVHVYTMNKPLVARKIVENLSDYLK